MLEQAADFQDESDALHRLLETVTDTDFDRATQFKGWTLTNIIGHLHMWNRAAALSLEDEAAFIEFRARVVGSLQAGRSLRNFEREWLSGASGKQLVENWRSFYPDMCARFHQADPKARLKWVGPDMSVRSSITARLMETWAHAQAIYDLLGVERVNTDRIKNIAFLGVNTFGWTFVNRKLEVPSVPSYVRLAAPSGAIWEWNEADATNSVSGDAREFCQVVTQIRNVADTELSVVGDTAQRWMSIAQCFAGPPEEPPAAGTRFRQKD